LREGDDETWGKKMEERSREVGGIVIVSWRRGPRVIWEVFWVELLEITRRRWRGIETLIAGRGPARQEGGKP